MSAPEIPGYHIESLIGKGSCGAVYAARHESGSLVTIKVLDRRACNLDLLRGRINRLYRSVPPKAAVPLTAHSLEKKPYVMIGGLMADRVVRGIGVRYIPRTLQLQLGEYLGKRGSWMLVRRLAQVLAEFHRRRVAHGNLKPGNVFFDTDGELLLSDYAQGLMPGIEILPYTDALLYAPPEQLTHPDGYLDGAGYGWDVYAFGALAFRLLNGVFPRCDETFSQVAPAVGEQRRPGVEADCERIAEKLARTALAPWSCPPPTREEEEGRAVIEKCLHLDPWRRYSDMREVLRALEAIATARQIRLTQEEEKKRVAHIERKGRGWRTTAAIGLAACVALGGLAALLIFNDDPPRQVTRIVKAEPDPGESGPRIDPAELEAARLEASQAARDREEIARETEAMRDEVLEMSVDLASAFDVSDQLVAWSVERGAVQLPTLEGRTGRLKVLEGSFHEFLERSDAEPSLARHRWRIKLALAEIALAANEPEVARQRLAEAIEEAPADDEAGVRRLTRARVLVCLLGSGHNGRGVSDSELVETETALASLPPDERETKRLQAALQLASARMKGRQGDTGAALEGYRTAFKSMTALCEEQPLLAALRVWRARGYTEAATAAHGEGAVDAALLLREQAAVELMELLERNPDRADVQVELSVAFGAIAEAALESGDRDRAEDLATRSLELLQAAVANPEEREGALIQLASQKSVLAACLGDRGRAKEALRYVEQGLQHVELVLSRESGDPLARYRLAILTWQKAGLRELVGAHDEALRLGNESRDLLETLLKENREHPSPREIRRSMAYLSSDLGHAAQLAGSDGDAVKFFGESVGLWKELATTEENNPEFQDGLEWAQMRLRELGAITGMPSERQ